MRLFACGVPEPSLVHCFHDPYTGSMPAELVKRYRPRVAASRSNTLMATVILTSAIQMYFKFWA